MLITVQYRVQLAQRSAFFALMQQLGSSRRRNGAVQWGVAEDAEAPGSYLEYFLDASWLEHLRQHERVSQDDQALQQQIRALLVDPAEAPRVRHYIGGEPGATLPPVPPAEMV